jgi:carbonic anhydrase
MQIHWSQPAWRGLVGALTAIVLTVPTVQVQGAEVHWGYHGEIGPEHWGELGFPLCSQGSEQSPIDLSPDGSVGAGTPALSFSYGVNNLSLLHNGHTVQANVLGTKRWLTLAGTRYDLVQFHAHGPSEHSVEQAQYPLEIHFVHRNPLTGELAVVGVFVRSGSAHVELNKVFGALPTTAGATRSVANFDLRRVLPSNRDFYSYDGSLTTPHCDEGVRWSVLRASIAMSSTQIQRFRALFSGPDFPEGNARPAQPRNGRTVLLVDQD